MTGPRLPGSRPVNRELTPRQQEALDFVREYLAEHGVSPTQREIADAMGTRSASSVANLLCALERKGAIQVQSGAARGIRIVEGST